MISLFLGLAAALGWGLHDFLVRFVSQKAETGPLLALALGSGAILLLPLTIWEGWGAVTPQAVALATGAGAALALASVGLYRAFMIGPVGLVAPICGAFPLGALALAWAEGRVPGAREWLAVALILGGIALVARQPGTAQPARGSAILWAALAAACFALTFHLSQGAARIAGTFPATMLARLTALVLVLAAIALRRDSLRPALRQWRWMGLIGALDVIAIGCVTAAGRQMHPEYAAIAASSFGVVTILLAWRFLAERLRPLQAAGAALAFAGITTLAAGS